MGREKRDRTGQKVHAQRWLACNGADENITRVRVWVEHQAGRENRGGSKNVMRVSYILR
jgi:hypothetical protein